MEHATHVAEIVGGVVALLVIAVAIFAATKRLKLPFTVVLVMCGMGLSYLTRAYSDSLPPLHELEISPGLILFVFLPTLIFESAFNLDARQLRHNLGPVLTLAVPGLLLSTVIIGLIVSIATPVPFEAALLLGAILSATDPVAVVALFKKLGAPQRLTILVEGESLFNDATSIVLSRILVGVIVVGAASAGGIVESALDFLTVFLGGLVVGWFLGLITGWILGKVESDPLIEITLTTVLAYMSFLLAEEVFHASGVMAAIAAGLTLGGWGRMKISPSVRTYLEHFWEYIGFVANALIFLMVGLRVDLSALWSVIDLLLWVLLAMLVSRLLVVFGLVPLAGRLPGAEPVSLRYQSVMFWGGLRGAIALAIVLSLPQFEQGEAFVTVVMGAVLFTLLVPGLTIEPLVRFLGLDRPPLADRFARVEGEHEAKQRALDRLPELLTGGFFSGSIGERLRTQSEIQLRKIRSEIETLRKTELNRERGLQLLYLRAFAEEKSQYIDMLNKGQLSEGAFRELSLNLALQIDAVRYSGSIRDVKPSHFRRNVETWALRLLDSLPLLSAMSERLRMVRIAQDYEVAWGHCRGSTNVLHLLDELASIHSMPPEVVEEVRPQYRHWQEASERQLHRMAEQFPEFVNALHERLGQRLMLFAEAEAVHHQAEHGTLPQSVAEEMAERITRELSALRGGEVAKLRTEPTELLRKVPSFQEIPPQEFGDLAARMRMRTVSENDAIIKQGQAGDSLFLIARGVVRVSREEEGVSRDLATLMAGDFFGEMALLHSEPRTATVLAVTPCSLYELNSRDLEVAMETFPNIRRALEEADRDRKARLSQG